MPLFVYILAPRPNGAIYVGSTNDLARRVEQHRSDAVSAHTKRYNIKTLVWFEAHDDLEASLSRERAIKRWKRAWKNPLIEECNPKWHDLSQDILF
ncbi:MAG: GIY-YIG nuclease family protein [Pseudomonadota bacterium]